MGASIRVGTILGIPLSIHYSWFIILVVVTVILANAFGESHPEWSRAGQWMIAVITSLLFFLSVLAHELSHSLVAKRQGIPVKGILLFIFGGVSQISREAQRPSTEFIVTVVGPFSSLLLGGMFAGLYFAVREANTQLAAIAQTLFMANVALGIFNMLPGFPLDGGRLLRSVIWGISGDYWRATMLCARGGQLMSLVIICSGLGLIFYREMGQGIWLAAIGWFLAMASTASYGRLQIHRRLQGYTAMDIMITDNPTIPPGTSLEVLTQAHIRRSEEQYYLVVQGGLCQGVVAAKRKMKIPLKRRSTVTVEQVMSPLCEILAVPPDENAFQVLELLDERDAQYGVVMQEGSLLGLINRDTTLRYIRRIRTGRPPTTQTKSPATPS